MVGSELREVALERRDRRFRARRAKLGSQRRQIHRMGLMLGLQLLLKCGNRCPHIADPLVLGLDIHGFAFGNRGVGGVSNLETPRLSRTELARKDT